MTKERALTRTELNLLKRLVEEYSGGNIDNDYLLVLLIYIEQAMKNETITVADFSDTSAERETDFNESSVVLKINLSTNIAELYFDEMLVTVTNFYTDTVLKRLNVESPEHNDKFIMDCFLGRDVYDVITIETDYKWDAITRVQKENNGGKQWYTQEQLWHYSQLYA